MKRTLIAIKFDTKSKRFSVVLTGLAKRDATLAEKLDPMVRMLRLTVELPSAMMSRNPRRSHGA